MIKRLFAFLLLVIFLTFQFFTDIDSEIVYINQKSMQTIIPAVDNTIEVIKQVVTVNNTNAEKGNVSDKYILSNSSDQYVSVPMIFPAIGWNADSRNLNIYVNDEIADYRIKWLLDSQKYNRQSINQEEVLTANPMQVLEDIENKKNYTYENISYDDEVIVYEISLDGNGAEISVENNADFLKVLYIEDDNHIYKNLFSKNSAKFIINGDDKGKFYIALFAEQIDNIKFVCSEKYGLKEMKLSQFVRKIIDQHYYSLKPSNTVSINTEIAPKIMYSIDQEMESNKDKSVMIDPQKMFENFMDIVYFTVDFEPNQSKTIELKYEVEGSTDKRKTTEPSYRYEYDPSASKLWKSHRGFEMKVGVGQNYKYFVDSSVNFQYEATANKYNLMVNVLPPDIIYYNIYNEDISLSEITDIRIMKKIEIIGISVGIILIVFIAMKIACIGIKEE